MELFATSGLGITHLKIFDSEDSFVDYLAIQLCNHYRTILVFCFYLSKFWKLYFPRNTAISLKFSNLLA